MPTVQVKLRIDPELHTALKIRAAQKRMHMSSLAEVFLLKGLAEDPLEAVEQPTKKEAIAP